jgi:hypothetical protein
MRGYKDALNLIVFDADEIRKLERTRRGIVNSGLSESDKENRIDDLDRRLDELSKKCIRVLHDLVTYPPHFLQYAQLIADFQRNKKNGEESKKARKGSVFIMTKYPDGNDTERDAALKTIIKTVKTAVSKCGFHAALAADTVLHPNLWENVECHMLACSHGIAIVDSKFRPDLNPNVAMEWGWMRAMGKPVLYLVEKDARAAADVAGLIKAPFDWLDPEATVPLAVSDYLKRRLPSPR